MAGYEYKPGLTISLLHEHKSRYQPDMLRAIGLTMTLPVALTFYITVFLSGEVGNEVVIDASDLISIEELSYRSKPISETSEETKKSSEFRFSEIRLPKYRHHEGFAGFDGYRTGKRPVSVGADYTSGSAIPPPEEFSIAVEYFDNSPVPSLELEDQDDGLPKSPTFFDFELPGSLPVGWNTPGYADGEIRQPTRDRPPMIKLERVKYPKRGWHVDGLVKIVLILNDKGQIKKLEIVREEPKGHDFAQAFKEALNESLFFPARINGRDVGIRYEFTYEFCWQCAQEPEIRVTRGDVIITSSRTKSK